MELSFNFCDALVIAFAVAIAGELSVIFLQAAFSMTEGKGLLSLQRGHISYTGGRSILIRTRILLAEDHTDMRNIVVRLLEPEFEVVGAVDNGQALLDVANKIQPDVLVVDISMPILSGIEAAERLQRAGSTARIVFLTVHEDPDFLLAAMAAGGLGYVVKSRLASDLRAAIKEALAGRLFVSPSIPLASPYGTAESED
jgi:CheY-like chemotaxis protein